MYPDDQPTDLERLAGLSRRRFLGAGALCSAALFFGGNPLGALAASVQAGNRALIGFDGIAASGADAVLLPPGYRYEVLISWGEPLHADSPAFDPSGNGSAADQEVQFGDNNDGMCLFPFPGEADRALLAINNEYTNYRYLYAHGGNPQSADEVHKALACEGVSVVEIRRGDGGWRFDRASTFNRRIHGNTPIRIGGPAAGHAWLRTAADPSGREVHGTFQNCSSGRTPWGTYLTCEENFTDCFGSSDPAYAPEGALKRYGVLADSRDVHWHPYDARFDVSKTPNEYNRHGWVVEIDPFDPQSKPVKRTALGRFKHENAALTHAADGRVVVYMGDDERGEFIYKFVSFARFDPAQPSPDLLDHGTLYVARFDDGDGDPQHPRGRGQWLELVHGRGGLDAAAGFPGQAEILIHTRLAASLVGATRMDRPEWIVVSPEDGQVYCTLTNNVKRGGDGQPAGGPNPRANNVYGQILRWRESGDDAAASSFEWDLFAVAGNPAAHPGTAQGGSPNISAQNMFNSPDGLAFDGGGRLWIQTDGDTSNRGDFAGMGNNQMLCADPRSGEIRRFMTGPVGCEVTGVAFAPDYRTLFIGIQHPGENGGSSFPSGQPDAKPRSSVLAIRRDDGGVIGAA